MSDKDKFDNNGEEFEKEDLQPIEGQIGIEELYIRGEETDEPEEVFTEPIDGQIGFDLDFADKEDNEKQIELKTEETDKLDENNVVEESTENQESEENFFKDNKHNFEDNIEENVEDDVIFKDNEDNIESEVKEDLSDLIEDSVNEDNSFDEEDYVSPLSIKSQDDINVGEFVLPRNHTEDLNDFFKSNDEEDPKETEEQNELNNFFKPETQEESIEESLNEVVNKNSDLPERELADEEYMKDKKANEYIINRLSDDQVVNNDVDLDEDEISKENENEIEENDNLDKLKLENKHTNDEELNFETEEDNEEDVIKDENDFVEEDLVEENEDNSLNEENDLNEDDFETSEDEEILRDDEGMEEEKKDEVKKVKVSTRKSEIAHEEKFFESEDGAKNSAEIEELNKDYEEVDMEVGQDVFGGYSNKLETSSIKEEEVIEKKKEKVISEDSGNDVIDGMLYKNLDTVLHESMIPYSEHVILDRALPRVEDGLKPVQRRILYSMLELGVTPDKPYRKSARIVGDCLGKYHPHGDSSVYQAMVRMAQPFNQNELLVSGHGNFGSVDGDGAAAMRYTEARLAPLAMELLRDLDKNTVKWGLNFDDSLKEPEILPGRYPNLLVNGAMGIAVGLATNIPPHNLAETIDGVVAYLNKPSITLKEMLKIIKGPDFPTGGYVLNTSEITQAYQTGKGKIYLRAKMHIESNGADKKYIVVTELPYQVNKSSLLQKIATLREEGKYGFGDISEIRDESDREGMRAVIRLKKDADLKTIYENLIKYTDLQVTFGMNMVAIAGGKPRQMGLLDVISYYAEYQREVIYRRSKYELEQAKEREHILAGLIIAIKNIDAVVKIIKTSQNTTEAKKRLREKFVLSEKQAQAILDMRLARLTSLEVYKLEAELKKLRELIKHLTAVINSKKMQFDIVKEEMLQIKKQFKSDRKTKMLKNEESLKIDAEPKAPVSQNVMILKSAQGNFKCVGLKQYNYSQKEVNDNSSLHDTHVLKFETESTKSILAFSNLGNCFKVDVSSFGESRYRDKGVAEKAIFKELGSSETIVALFDGEDVKLQQNLIFLTKYGMIKKTALSEYALLKKYFQGMKLKDGDEIVKIVKEPETYTVVFVTKTGMVLNAENGDIPLQGRISGGVKGINLATNDYCVGATLAGDGGEVVAVTDKGYAKRVLLSNIDKMARYRKGLKFFTFTKDNGNSLVFADVVTTPYTVVCLDNENQMYYRNTDLIPIEARIGKGKPVEKLKKSLSIVKAFGANN